MPAWKGWDEAGVRQPMPQSSGFTPINAPAPTASVPGGIVRDTTQQTPTIRNVEAVSSAAGRTADAPGGEKTTKKTRKRASTDTKATTSKRQKTDGHIDDTPTLAEDAPVKVLKEVAKASKPSSSRSKQVASTKTKRNKGAPEGSGSNATAQMQPDISQLGYAPATSMEKVQQSAPLTSMNVLSAAQGYGTTLYDSHFGTNTPLEGLDMPRLFLTPRTHRRNSKKTACAPRLSPAEEEDGLDLLFEQITTEFDSGALAVDKAYAVAIPVVNSTQLPTPCNSDEPAPTSTRRQPARKVKKLAQDEIQTEEDFFNSHASDEEGPDIDHIPPPRSPAPPSRDRKHNAREVEHDEDYGGALLTDAEKKILHELKVAQQNSAKTIVRKPFPKPVLDRSPIFGASNSALLRTCFRVGEALNVGCQAVRENKTVLLELYARVMQSWREEKPGRHQHFVLHDLYHDNPPHVNGTFDLWDQSRLWELDSKAFLVGRSEGIMCRLIGRMKPDGQKWKLEILSIWEATWEDVESVAGICARPGGEPWLNEAE
ncbi:hypothetical protein LTR78_006133 [Recurvomyces mirabilis]|uniref:Uncharacterized protein n=1 Tax=Recurvomyces mirabilis TaxID=574656 RepID=A0AAE0WLK5_9PEZI|nr:hypothetical protein LTR78_006133 [Recurvomyces mirabilis]KAK5151976.1 hypothetical protein LTS14_008750 [Recurvomyces mirabilis]